MALQQQDKTMIRVLITQKNENGTIKEVNGVKQIGGVVEDNIGEVLGYVFDDSKYDKEMNRKPEHYVYNWYRQGEEA